MNFKTLFYMSLAVNLFFICLFTIGYVELRAEGKIKEIESGLEKICMYNTCAEFEYYDTVVNEGLCICLDEEMNIKKQEVYTEYIYKR